MKTKLTTLLLCAALLLTACTSPPAATTIPTTTAPPETTVPVETTTAPAELTRYPLNADSTYVNLAQQLPAHIYTTTGSENGLGGTVYSFEGIVKYHDSFTADGFVFERAVVETDGGEVLITNYYKAVYNASVLELGEALTKAYYPTSVDDYVFPSDGERAVFLATYGGFSGSANLPSFYLGANAGLFFMLDLPDPAQAQSTQPPAVQDTAATQGEKNALKTAEDYLRFSEFSYSGLIDQLEYEGYTKEEATYAADNCGADWKEQALKNAQSYLSFSAFSYEGLIDQLEYEGYTKEEAAYAVDNCGADWMEQAVKCAESYLSFSSFSKSKLIDQLEYEGFTHEQAVYGAEQNGY